MTMTMLRSAVALALVSTALSTTMALADTPRVGVTSAVNPAAAGTPPGAATRQLVIGGDVVFRERVITTDEGQAQILFLDQSSLMIGPNSTVVIDEFVYDPSTSKGSIAATLTQGSFRYIGGKLSKQGNATLKTPVATIGIRGSDVTVTFDSAKNEANVVTTHGTANVQTLGGGVLGLRTGFGTTVDSSSRPPVPSALTAEQILAANAQFEGKAGKSAGASELPTDGKVSQSGLGSAVEAQGLAAIAPAAGGFGPNSTQLLNTVVNQINQTVTNATQQEPTTPGSGGVVTSPPPPVPDVGTRTDQTLNGFVAGFAYQFDATDGAGDVVMNDQVTAVEIRTMPHPDGGGRVLARLGFHTIGEGSTEATMELGDPPGSGSATQSTFVNDAIFNAQQNADASADKARINGVAANVTGVLVTLPLDSVGLLTEGGANTPPLCQCEFVKWGLWLASLDAPDSASLLVPGGLWVAGKLPDINEQPGNVTATFSGTAVGMVHNPANQGSTTYFASGSFTNTYNFGAKSGTVQVQNFDGKSFSGTVGAGSDWRTYRGSVSGSGLTGHVNGAFYGNRNAAGQLQTPKETAGNFQVGGGGYTATGVFAGSR
jgi:hypothetical protein